MAVLRDSLGRRKRKCKTRYHPMTEYRSQEFTARFRLSKKVVRALVSKWKPYSTTKGMRNGGGLSFRSRFCLALRYFSTGGNYALCGDSQHVSKSLASRAIIDVSNYFYNHASEYMHWPTTMDKLIDNSEKFYRHKKQHTPGVVGMVDGTHVSVLSPKVNESCYVNRHGYHSINSTIYADFDQRIMHVDARWPGSVNDAFAFNCSPVGDLVKSGGLGNFILLADSGYALKKNVFTPYLLPKTPKQHAYNTWHKTNRCKVEQTIGILKQRFRCLDSAGGYMYHTPTRAARIIITCCCLHNVAMDHGIKIINHPKDPWIPARERLLQPNQRAQRQTRAEIRAIRDKYCNKHF